MIEATEHVVHVALFIMLRKMFLTVSNSVEEILACAILFKNYCTAQKTLKF